MLHRIKHPKPTSAEIYWLGSTTAPIHEKQLDQAQNGRTLFRHQGCVIVRRDSEIFAEARVPAGAMPNIRLRIYADAENLLQMIEWLNSRRVVTPRSVNARRQESFNVLSRSLWKPARFIYSGNLPGASSFPRGIEQGGSYTADYAALYYN